MSRSRDILFWMSVLWALPNTCIGLTVGLFGCLTGGRMQRRGIALEFHGGVVLPFLNHCCGHWVSAITFGHTILGRNPQCLDECRAHEWVHVRQYQRWGPLFLPAYLLNSIWVWSQGKRPYRDNIFEREAYGDE